MKTTALLILAFCIALVASSDAAPHPDADKAGPDPARTPKTRPAAAGSAIGENTATPVSRIKSLPGFSVELLYSVPAAQGSWINLCVDDKGRIYASDQYGGLYRITPPAPGHPLEAAGVEKVPADIRAVNGMVFAFGAMYVAVNDYPPYLTDRHPLPPVIVRPVRPAASRRTRVRRRWP